MTGYIEMNLPDAERTGPHALDEAVAACPSHPQPGSNMFAARARQEQALAALLQ